MAAYHAANEASGTIHHGHCALASSKAFIDRSVCRRNRMNPITGYDGNLELSFTFTQGIEQPQYWSGEQQNLSITDEVEHCGLFCWSSAHTGYENAYR